MSERIRTVMGSLTLDEFGKSLGVSAQAVSQWLSGKTKPDQKNLMRMASLYKVDLNWLMNDEATDTFHEKSDFAASTPSMQRVEATLGARDLPVFAAVEGGDGDLVVSTERVDLVPRPWYLGEVKDGFAVIVTGESMVPAYEPGDMAIVNPRLTHMRGKIHIFTAESENSHFKATIKKLVSVTETDWVVEQFNPPKTFKLPKSEWTHAKRVVGKYND